MNIYIHKLLFDTLYAYNTNITHMLQCIHDFIKMYATNSKMLNDHKDENVNTKLVSNPPEFTAKCTPQAQSIYILKIQFAKE